MTTLTDEQLLTHTASRLPHLEGASLAPIEKGGSARRFHRVSALGGSAILVHDLGEREENKHYASLAGFLSSQGVPVPAVLATDMSITKMLAAYGVTPDMVMGHSLGEYGALVAAGSLALSGGTIDGAGTITASNGYALTNGSIAASLAGSGALTNRPFG